MAYGKILVPQDGSDVGSSVVPFVASIARAFQARVTVMTALDMQQRTGRNAETEIWAEAQATVRRQSQLLADAGVETDAPLVVSGVPSQQIVSQAREGGFDLVAMSTRGHSGVRRGLLGSVTDEVIRSTTTPVLVMSPSAIERSDQNEHRLTGLTVALDGSELAETILPHAEELAQQLSLGIHLVRVIALGSLAYYASEGLTMDTAPVEEELEEEAEAYLEQVARRLSDGGTSTEYTVMKGSPALTIIEHLSHTSGNLAAICTHGRSGFGRLLIGSVADSIIRSAGVPVLVFAAPPNS
jgi:nucleotide-binding universal stress UspA family protein